MKVVLLNDIDRVGKAGEVVEVSEGFGRNFLFPRKKALLATDGALKQYEERKRAIAKQQAALKTKAEEFAKTLEGLKIDIKANVGEEGKLFGAITTQDIYLALKKLGTEVEKKNIEISAPFKEVGTFPVKIRLHPEVEVTIQISIS
jgi:large subunit ribosomal protein L9